MKRSSNVGLILGLCTLLCLGSLALSQPAETPQPTATEAASPAQPAAPAATTAPDATAEPPSEGNASEGSVSNEDGTSEEEGDATLEEIMKAVELVFLNFKTLGVIGGLIALISLFILVLRYPRLNNWLEKKGWKKYKRIAAVILGGGLAGLTAAAGGAVWWKALVAGAIGVVAGLGSIGLHNLFTGGNADKKKK